MDNNTTTTATHWPTGRNGGKALEQELYFVFKKQNECEMQKENLN